MKILVIGTGAIGGLYAAKLSQVGAEVSVVCRSD
ncbi:MAG: NAD-binding protein [Proteobacteria bacterium]|nr:NAD-binding protein [Pseudomonadota bacterium]